MSKNDEGQFSDPEDEMIDSREEGGRSETLLEGNLIPNREELPTPSTMDLEIRSLESNTFVEMNFSLEFKIPVWVYDPFLVSMYVMVGGTKTWELTRDFKGLTWHHQGVTTGGRYGPAKFVGNWKHTYPYEHWKTEVTRNVFSTRLPIIDPQSVFTNAITGSGGDETQVSVWIPKSQLISGRVPVNNSRWSIPLSTNIHPGTFNITVEQFVSGYDSRYSFVKNILYLTYPKVSIPANNGVVKLGSQVPVSGAWGAPNENIQVMNLNGTINFGEMRASSSGSWGISANFSAHYPYGGWQYLMVRHEGSGDAAWTKVSVFLLAPPSIDAGREIEMDDYIYGGGHAGFTGHSVDIFIDLSSEKISGAHVGQDGRWAARVILNPGPRTLTAQQLYNGVRSERAALRVFHVKPPPPTLAFQRIGDRIDLHGTGYSGARMDVHLSKQTAVFLDATVASNGTWLKTIPASTPPGDYSLGGRQSVSDGGSGRIYNTGWVAEISLKIFTPTPTVSTPTVNERDVTFSGTGHQWGAAAVQVVIFKNSGITEADVLLKVNVSPARGWTGTVALPPGRYQTLHARQWVNSQYSDPVPLAALVVRSPPPQLDKPESGTIVGQSPQISGSAYAESVVTFSIPGRDPFTKTATAGTFDFPAEELAPRTYTMTVTAAFGGQTSDTITRTFTVKTPVPKISASDGDPFDPVPTIKGQGYKNCWVIIRSADNHEDLGRGPVGPNGEWSVQLTEQPLGSLSLYAVQLESENSANKSDATATVTVDIQLRAPGLLVPPPNARPERTSQFSGEALEGSTVELWIKGQSQPFMKDIPVRQGGNWDAQVKLPAGPMTLEVSVRYKGASSDKTERIVTVVPNVPVIDTPLSGEPLGAMLRISGYGFPGDSILVHRRTHYAHLATVEVTDEGTWSASVRHYMVADDAITVMAMAQAGAGAGLGSKNSPALFSTFLKPAPQIIEPQPGDWTGVRPLYSGLAEPGATITVASWFDPDSLLAEPTVADENGRWSVRGNKDLPEGAAWVVIRQSLEGTLSEWVESGRFMVERVPATFEAPTVTFPQMGQEVGRWPMFEGRGVPGAEVILYKKGDMNTVLGRAWVDRQGAWAVRSLIELAVGDNFGYGVHQARDGVFSKWLTPDRMFNVKVHAGNEALIIDTPRDDASQVLEQQPVFSGSGIPGAEVEVYASDFTVLARTRVNAQGHWSVRSEVVLQAHTHTIHAEQFMDGIHFSETDQVSFTVAEKLELPVIVSPAPGAHISPYGVIKGTALPGTTVRLLQSGDGHTTWGLGIADAQGEWLIVVKGLPVGNFLMGGEGTKNQMTAKWMAELNLKVINAG